MSIPNGTPLSAARQVRAGQPGTPPSGMAGLLPVSAWRHSPALRSWPVLLFFALICVPAIALAVVGQSPTGTSFEDGAWIFAGYFAVAWLLLLGVIIRPEHVTRPMLAVITVIALVTEIPLAAGLETALHSGSASPVSSILTIGVPEELAKAVPILAAALIYRRHRSLDPRDYLFLGAVSGLVFGASEAVHYFTTNVPDELSNLISQQPQAAFDSMISLVLTFSIGFVWRFLTDPIGHACWSGLTGYFIGLALTGRYKWYKVGWIGFALAAVLHGLNDLDAFNGHLTWILVVLVSGLLFLGYAKAGPAEAGQPAGLTAGSAATATAASHTPPPAAPAAPVVTQPAGQTGPRHVPWPSGTGPAAPAAPATPAGADSAAWWQPARAPSAALAVQTPGATAPAPAPVGARPASPVPPSQPAPRPWWEQ